MKALLFSTVAAGLAIGAMLPGSPRAPVPSAPAPAASTPKPAPAADAPQPTVLTREAAGPFVATAEVNGVSVRFVVDTGASATVLTEEDARRAGIGFDPAQFRAVARGAAGPVRGQPVTINAVALDGKAAFDLHGYVIENGTASLLGQDYLSRVTVEMRGNTMTLR